MLLLPLPPWVNSFWFGDCVRTTLCAAGGVECSKGTIDWRGFRSTQELQQEMGHCRALINTPKWNEAYGNVVVEALAQVFRSSPMTVADRGADLFRSHWLVGAARRCCCPLEALRRVDSRRSSAAAGLRAASCEVFSQRVEAWIRNGLMADVSINPKR